MTSGDDRRVGAINLGSLTVTVGGDHKLRRVTLAGRLDETSPLSEQADRWKAEQVVIDSGGVEAINSIGVREWMHFLAGLVAAGSSIVHERCAEPVVEQMCFIPAARAGGEVRSFFAPYQCTGCGVEVSALIEVEPHAEALYAHQAPSLPCQSCSATMELADAPERILVFLERDADHDGARDAGGDRD